MLQVTRWKKSSEGINMEEEEEGTEGRRTRRRIDG
jgi:hypothetical protein